MTLPCLSNLPSVRMLYDMNEMAKMIMLAGAGLFFVGLLFYFGSRLPWFGQLPGDIVVKRDNFTFFMPLGTMLLVSVLLTIVVNVIGRLFR